MGGSVSGDICRQVRAQVDLINLTNNMVLILTIVLTPFAFPIPRAFPAFRSSLSALRDSGIMPRARGSWAEPSPRAAVRTRDLPHLALGGGTLPLGAGTLL